VHIPAFDLTWGMVFGVLVALGTLLSPLLLATRWVAVAAERVGKVVDLEGRVTALKEHQLQQDGRIDNLESGYSRQFEDLKACKAEHCPMRPSELAEAIVDEQERRTPFHEPTLADKVRAEVLRMGSVPRLPYGHRGDRLVEVPTELPDPRRDPTEPPRHR
jgi:hypothetical protein